jgi:hypothetical protein
MKEDFFAGLSERKSERSTEGMFAIQVFFTREKI